MEGIPFSNEHDDEDKAESESKSTSKSAENLGAFLVEPKTETPKPSLLEGLFKREAAAEATPNAEPAVAVEDIVDSPESQEPLDQLSPAESVAVEQQIVRSRQAETSNEDDDTQTQSALAQFRSKILDQGKNSDQALTETLDTIESEDEVPETTVESQPVAPVITAEQPAQATTVESDPKPVATPQPMQPMPFGPGQVTIERPAPTPPQPEVVVVERRDGSDLLVGGIVGYLIGRRRGRIRTEKRLLPIQAKLEKQVKTMEANIIAKEAAIRAAVQENQNQSAAATELQKTTERLRRSAEQRTEQPESATVTRSEQQPVVTPETTRTVQFAETLSRAQLLAIAENIKVDGVPLRRTFEANRISEDGLRRIVGEHLRGGDVARALRLELVDGEQAYERDPIMRDNAAMLPQPVSADAPSRPAKPVMSIEEAQALHQKATLEARQAHEKISQTSGKQKQRILDVTLASVIFVLLIAIIGLVMARR